VLEECLEGLSDDLSLLYKVSTYLNTLMQRHRTCLTSQDLAVPSHRVRLVSWQDSRLERGGTIDSVGERFIMRKIRKCASLYPPPVRFLSE